MRFLHQLESGDCETLTATTFIRSVRVFELKGPVQTTLSKINSGTLQIGQTFMINEDFYTLVLEDIIVTPILFSDTYFICPTGAPGLSDAKTQRNAVVFIQKLFYTLCCIIG